MSSRGKCLRPDGMFFDIPTPAVRCRYSGRKGPGGYSVMIAVAIEFGSAFSWTSCPLDAEVIGDLLTGPVEDDEGDRAVGVAGGGNFQLIGVGRAADVGGARLDVLGEVADVVIGNLLLKAPLAVEHNRRAAVVADVVGAADLVEVHVPVDKLVHAGV